MNVFRVLRGSAAVLLVAGIAACQSSAASPTDKVGSDVVLVHMADSNGDINPNGQTYAPQAFIDAIARVSGGRMRAVVDQETYTDGAPDAEVKILSALKAGQLDAAWPSTRAFAAAGIPGLEAVEAPFTITNYDAERELVTSPVADALLSKLQGSGVAGLALAVGPLRRPFAVDKAMTSPADWEGQNMRSFMSTTQDAVYKALKATPVHAGSGWTDDVKAGKLHGGEFDLAQFAHGDGYPTNHVVSNVVLWPKVFVLAASQRFLDSLSDEQRGWLQQAAEEARKASITGPYDDAALAKHACDLGAVFTEATDSEVAELKAAVKPVIANLAKDGTFAEIQAIAAKHPQVDAVPPPSNCGPKPASVPAVASGPQIPDGTYRVTIGQKAIEASGVPNDTGPGGIWTLTIDQGKYTLACAPYERLGKDCGNNRTTEEQIYEAGSAISVDGHVTFVHDGDYMATVVDCSKADCEEIPPYGADWSFNGTTLRFREDPPNGLTIAGWTKID